MSDSNFSQSIAIIIGVNNYANGIARLQNATNDARALAKLLKANHGYKVQLLVDEAASLSRLLLLLKDELPRKVSPSDRVLFYFAGHGIALDGEDGPAGYLVPQDAQLSRGDLDFLSMRELHDSLMKLPCRHALVILDCCFSGAFRWSTLRDIATGPEVVYQERYDRFIRDPAWQVITSAAYDQTALDAPLNNHRRQDLGDRHSPFAQALIEGLQGAADLPVPGPAQSAKGDGVITATELYVYLRARLEPKSEDYFHRQTPGLWHLHKHDKGEYIFLVPGHELNLPPAPPLNLENNPYRGLETFEEKHAELFFGRQAVVEELYCFVKAQPLAIVSGASGTGKSSLVKAGLIPTLKQDVEHKWEVLPILRPGESPIDALAEALTPLLKLGNLPLSSASNLHTQPKQLVHGHSEPIALLSRTLRESTHQLASIMTAWTRVYPKIRLVLVVDQLEELITQCPNKQDTQHFLKLLEGVVHQASQQVRIVITLRSDFEPLFIPAFRSSWMQYRFVVPPFTQDELRQAIEGPARERVIYFDPSSLVDQLINEVVQMPGALPLLSFTLSELYRKYLQRRSSDRALTVQDYQALNGVTGALTQRANEEYEALVQQDERYAVTLRYVLLRMVAVGGSELARRRVPLVELEYPDSTENQRVAIVIQRLVEARLLVQGQDTNRQTFVEPAHDALILGWDRILQWQRQYERELVLQRSVTRATQDWQERGGALWNADPSLDYLKSVKNSAHSWLNAYETEFVQQSINQRRKNRVARYSFLTLFVTGLGTASAITYWQLTEARRRGIENLTALSMARQQSDNLLGALVAGVESGQQVTAINQGLGGFIQRRTQPVNWSMTNFKVTMAIHHALAGLNEQNRLLGHSDRIMAIDVGQRCAGQEPLIASASRDRTVKLWHPEGSRTIHQGDAEVRNVRLSPDCTLVAAVDYSGTVRVWQVESGNLIQAWQQENPLLALDWSADGKHIATGDQYGRITIWSPQGENLAAWQAHEGQVNQIQFMPNCKKGRITLASAGELGTVQLWDLTGNLVQTLAVSEEAWLSDVSWSPNCEAIAASSHDSNIYLWTLENERFVFEKAFQGHRGPVHGIDFSPNGEWIVSAGAENIQTPSAADNQIILWNRQGTVSRTFEGHEGPVMSVRFLMDDSAWVSASDDLTVRTWRLEGTSPIQDFARSEENILDAKIAPNGDSVFTLNNEGKAYLWEAASQTFQHLKIPNQKISQIYYSDRNTPITVSNENLTITLWQSAKQPSRTINIEQPVSLLASGLTNDVLAWSTPDNSVYLHTLKSSQTLRLQEAQEGYVTAIVFSPNAQTLAVVDAEGTVKLWKSTGESITEISGGFSVPEGKTFRFSPDSQVLAALSQDGQSVKLWNLKGEQIAELEGHDGVIQSIRFSPSGKFLATASEDRTVRIWHLNDLNNLEPVVLEGHDAQVSDLRFRADERIIASIGVDDEVKLWSINGEPISDLTTLPGTLKVGFSSDDNSLVSINRNGAVRVWKLDLHRLVEQAQSWLCNQYEDSVFANTIREDTCKAL